MPQEPTYNSVDTGYSTDLPLESLILSLKKNGFSIKPDDYIEILKVIERFQPATLEEAGDLICPLIVTNDEEQSRFHVVFKKLCEVEATLPPPTPPSNWRKFLNASKKIFTKRRGPYFLIAIPILIGVSWLLNIPSLWRHPKKVIIGAGINWISTTPARIGDSIIFYPGWKVQLGDSIWYSNQEPFDTSTTTIEWDLGDGWQSRNKQRVFVVPSRPGAIHPQLRMYSAKKLLSTETATIEVCEKVPDVTITANYYVNVPLNTPLILQAKPSYHSGNFSSAWLLNGDTVKKNSDTLNREFSEKGSYTISYVLIPNDNPACHKKTSLTFDATDPNEKKFQLQTEQIGDVITAPKKIKNWLQNLILSLFLISLFTSIVLNWIKRRRQKAGKKILDTAFEPPIDSASDKKPVFEIPLQNRQQQLIASEPAMNTVMRFMLQRTMDESLSLNIHQTVQNTIRSGGIPDLVYSNKLRHNDYLILIDSTVTNSQQLKLFEYLVKTFKSESINAVRFFYQDNFSKFHNEEYPAGLSLKRVSELYKDFTLIIYGNVRHLVYDAYPVIDAERIQELGDWESKGILTPIPFKDWSIKEKLIAEQLILLPADASGQLRLIKAINEKLLKHRDYLSSEKEFYSAEKFDFTDTDDIKKYLNDEDLFQWTCAIAIYPKIRWEILIELGKAVLQSRGCSEKLNYTNLLRIARISWMHEGYFPEHTRLELLKQLGTNEEIVARKKLVELFQYADIYFKDNYFFSKEKKVQEITNKFILYANDPAKNESYSSSKEQFEELWKQNKITDAPLKEYIDNSKTDPWKTPIRNEGGEPVSTGEYFDGKAGLPQKIKIERWVSLFKEISGILFLLILLLYFLGNKIAEMGAGRFLGISTVDSFRIIPVTVDIVPFGLCLNNNSDTGRLHGVKFSLYNDPAHPYEPTSAAAMADTLYGPSIVSQTFELPYRFLISGFLKLKVDWTSISPADVTDITKVIEDKKQQFAVLRDNLANATAGSKQADSIIKQMVFVKDYIKQLENSQKAANQSQTSDITFATNKLNITVNGCTDSVINININYNDPSLETDVTALSSLLSKNGYKEITKTQAAFTDSLLVKYYASKDSVMAVTFAKQVSDYFKKPYSAQFSQGSSNARFEIMIYKKPDDTSTCTSIPISQLPSSLTEIWKGLNIPQLITIDVRNKKIWYSQGDKKIYDTYNISDVCLSGTGVYKVIGEMKRLYKVFFIKNLQPNQFVLSVCDGLQTSKELAMQVDEASCKNYHRMNIYNNDPGFPVDADVEKSTFFFLFEQNDQLFPSEYRRLNATLTEAKAKGKRGETASLINSFFTPKNFAKALEEKQFATTKTKLPSFFGTVLDNSSKSRTFDGTPFDRHCLLVGLSKDVDVVPPITISFLKGTWQLVWGGQASEAVEITEDGKYYSNGVHTFNITNFEYDKSNQQIKFVKNSILDPRVLLNTLNVENNNTLVGVEENYNAKYTRLSTIPSLIKKEWGPLDLKHDCGYLEKDVWVINPTNTCNDKNKYSSHGAFVKLPPGNYVAEWELAADSIPPKVGFVAQIHVSDASDAGKILDAHDITVTDFIKANNSFKTFQISFTVGKSVADHLFEFRVLQAANVTVKLRKIRVTQK